MRVDTYANIYFNGEGYYCRICEESAEWDEEVDLPFCHSCQLRQEEESEDEAEVRA